MLALLALATFSSLALARPQEPEPEPSAARVEVLRVPDGGIQPQLAVAADGTLHLVAFHGDPHAGDLVYSRSTDGGARFGPSLRVNRHDSSAVAIGSVRGAHLALGPEDRPHVLWIGSEQAQPRGAAGETPLCYARLADSGEEFEPERDLAGAHAGLDGGASIAADAGGNVYAVWHAPALGATDETGRRVWVARSADDGASFSPERPAWDEPTGACGCCALRACCAAERVWILYRAAREGLHRDMYALVSADDGRSFRGSRLDGWDAAQCVMSTAALARGGSGALAAWETEGQVRFAPLDPQGRLEHAPLGPPGPAGVTGGRKHPVVAANARGEVLVAWTEGTGWERGGRLAWQVWDSTGKLEPEAGGARDGVPTWSLVAAAARADQSFVILY